jgi:Zn-dependent peptidase ImmA (M78 family)
MKRKAIFKSPLSLGLLASVPGAKTPVDAILWHAKMLFIESGMTKPPFSPALYAPLRRVKEIILKNIEVEGRLLPCFDGFIIELRKDRSHERKNFTCAHELGHTFFYESVPTIKYRANSTSQLHRDEEEERLCNIAAAELLMPSSEFSKIVKDYVASPKSLQDISNLFEVSLVATVVNLLKHKLWNATFILWKQNNNKLEAEWIAQPNCNLVYSPAFEIVNFEKSSIYKAFQTDELIKNQETLKSRNGTLSDIFQSMKLNNRRVLSCIKHNSTGKSLLNVQTKIVKPTLPIEYECKCNGRRYIIVEQNGKTSAIKCLATEHKIAILPNQYSLPFMAKDSE